jgi:hypothetical protein
VEKKKKAYILLSTQSGNFWIHPRMPSRGNADSPVSLFLRWRPFELTGGSKCACAVVEVCSWGMGMLPLVTVITDICQEVTIPFITLLLTPWSEVLLQKQTFAHLVKEFPAYYGTSTFITLFTGSRHWTLSWAVSLRCKIFSFFYITLSSQLLLGLPSSHFPSDF